MQILYLDEVNSTQKYLKEQLQKEKLHSPVAVSAEIQKAGVGSRDNSWEGFEGNLFLSFSLPLCDLPDDLKVESASIYFSYILKETLAEFGSDVFIKWPNDFYIKNKKIGGMITHIFKQDLICGVGINLKSAPKEFDKLDVVIEKRELLENYFKKIEKKVLWKKVFSKYRIEFSNNYKFFTHINNQKVSLRDATLEEDGSLNINGERIYSLR
ncbi:MAG: biotin--[acetyl-CoA-carboxylase] ligase [Sulfurimonas sp.]